MKGASTNPNVCRAVEVVHIMMFELHLDIWFEYVPSKLNFAEGVSRDLNKDECCGRLGATPVESSPARFLWELPLRHVWDSLGAALG